MWLLIPYIALAIFALALALFIQKIVAVPRVLIPWEIITDPNFWVVVIAGTNGAYAFYLRFIGGKEGIDKSAQLLVEEHGKSAAEEAERRANVSLTAGNSDDYKTWMKIKRAVEKLQNY